MAKSKKIQEFLPEMAPQKNRRIHTAALQFLTVQSERVTMTNKEREAHDRLLGIMQEEGVQEYNYGELSIVIGSGKQKCSVKLKSESDDEREEEAE